MAPIKLHNFSILLSILYSIEVNGSGILDLEELQSSSYSVSISDAPLPYSEVCL